MPNFCVCLAYLPVTISAGAFKSVYQASGLFFVFTLSIFTTGQNSPGYVLVWVFIVLNPLFLYMANYVSSDAIFVGLSLTWFTLLIMADAPASRRLIKWHAVLLFLAFTVATMPLIYPLIALLAIALSSLSIRRKIAAPPSLCCW